MGLITSSFMLEYDVILNFIHLVGTQVPTYKVNFKRYLHFYAVYEQKDFDINWIKMRLEILNCYDENCFFL